MSKKQVLPVKQVFFLLLLTAVLMISGCIDDEDGTKLSISGNNTEINISLSDQAEGGWCPAGSQVQVKNPTTGKALNMTIIGTENFENKTFCKAVIETGSEENTSRFEYLWSQDKNTTVWTKYDDDGNMSLRYVHRK